MKVYLNKSNNQKGEVSKILLVGFGAVLIIITVTLVLLFFNKINKPEELVNNADPNTQEPTKPVYEKQIGDINFVLESSEDLGNVLKATVQHQNDLTTTEKFIKVVVTAQNKGKVSTTVSSWGIGNIVDSEGRVFSQINAFYFLPNPNPCGISLKPAFYPVSCTKIYEVSRVSQGLKLEIYAKDQKTKELLDLKFE